MKKYFVCSDIHSYYDEWMTALEKAGFDHENDDHHLILCGDLLDRGPKPLECLKFVCDLIDRNRMICIKGNHELMFEEVTSAGYFTATNAFNGTIGTFEGIYPEYNHKIVEDKELIRYVAGDEYVRKYFASLRWYYETELYVFVHSWFPATRESGKLKNRSWREGDWSKACWVNPFELWHAGKTMENKTVVCGHWHTFTANSLYHDRGLCTYDDIFFHADKKEIAKIRKDNEESWDILRRYFDFSTFKEKGIIALDACTALSHLVNIEILTKGMKEVK